MSVVGVVFTQVLVWFAEGHPSFLLSYCTPNTHMWGVTPCYSYIDLQFVPLEFGHASNLVFLNSTGTHMLQRTHPSWLWHIWRTTEQPHHCHLWNRQPISASVVWLYMIHWTVLHLFVMWIPSISPKKNQCKVGVTRAEWANLRTQKDFLRIYYIGWIASLTWPHVRSIIPL